MHPFLLVPFEEEGGVVLLTGMQNLRSSSQEWNLGLVSQTNALSYQLEPNLSGASLFRQRMKLFLTSGRHKLQPTALLLYNMPATTVA